MIVAKQGVGAIPIQRSILQKEIIMDICGSCGKDGTEDKNGLCGYCKADYWIQPEDFDNPELNDYICHACESLGMSRKQLHKKVNTIVI